MGCGLCKSAFNPSHTDPSPYTKGALFVPSSLFTVAEEISELEESKPLKGCESRVITLITTVNRAGTESEGQEAC